MLDRAQLEAFAAVVQHGNFERAASVLNVTRGAISQRVKALEEALASVLLVREKPVVATSKGKILLRHVRALKAMEDDTFSAIMPTMQERAPVPIAIAVNADSLATWFGHVVVDLLTKYKIALEIICDDQDYTFHRLVKGEVVGCVSSKPAAFQGFDVTPLGAMHYLCVATPEFKEKYFRTGLSISSVLAAPAMLFDRKDALHDMYLEQLFGVEISQYTRHFLPSPVALQDGILAGLGYAMEPHQRVKHLLASGELVELTSDCRVTVPLYWHHWKLELPQAQAMTQVITAHALKTLDQSV